jgi:hypothetical protein
MTRIAYLEISPRITGKTTRMVERARAVHAAGQQVVFVVPNGGLAKHLATLLPGIDVVADKDVPRIEQLHGSSTWFYDEFDWIKATRLREGAYYATTPRYARRLDEPPQPGDVLGSLLEANGDRFERHLVPFFMPEVLQAARAELTPQAFRLLHLGEPFA